MTALGYTLKVVMNVAMKKTFRRFAALLILLTAGFSCLAENGPKQRKQYLLYVGTYTVGERQQATGSKGIYAFRIGENANALDKLEITALGAEAETPNPSFLAADPSGHYLYAVNELTKYKDATSGAITAYALDRKTGKLTYLNETGSRGADPCYISFDKTGRYALVANYTGGSVAVFPVSSDGRIGEVSAFVQHIGKGARPDRQEGPHAHWIETARDNRIAVAADLGLDELLVYRFDATKGSLTANDPAFAKLTPGTGPRHVAFAPNNKFAYVVDELNSTVTTFTYDAGRGVLKQIQTISTLPAGFSGANDTAEIHVHPNGKFLFASNRGHDSIVVFGIDQYNGKLALVDHFATTGKTPRNFEIDPSGRFLFAANEASDNIAIFRIDEATGRLATTGQILTVPAPVSLRFVAAD
jgi:6-phosphogluconolactonase